MDTITIQLKDYMVAYLYVRYGQCVESFGYACPLPAPIRLPHESRQDDTLYRTLYRNTVVQPDRVLKQCGNVTFVIPCPHGGKSAKQYNYLGAKGLAEIRKAIRGQIKMELFDFMVEQRYTHGHTYTYGLGVFLRKYGMEDLVSEDSLLRLFYGWRRKQKLARKQQEKG